MVYQHTPAPELDVYQFNHCQVCDFDTIVNGEFTAEKEEILAELVPILADKNIPCVLEETTNGYHVIILSPELRFKSFLSPVLGFDYVYDHLCNELDDVVLRTRRKKHETEHFILSREYFHMWGYRQACVKEFLLYSDKIMQNLCKPYSPRDEWDEWDDTQCEF